MVKCNRIRSWL